MARRRPASPRNILGSAEYNFFVSHRTFLNANILLEKDMFQNVLLRTSTGAGVGYQFVETSRSTLFGEVGLAYVNEHYTTIPVRDTPSTR